MSRRMNMENVSLSAYDRIFDRSGEKVDSEKLEEVPLSQLHAFKDHPFQVKEDESLAELADSILKHGVLVPATVRKRKGGGYEIISGHRRCRASELAGKTTMPVFIKEYTDDEAVIVMVDSNIQREKLLPSEKAKAYAMKYEAMKHQGIDGGGSTLSAMSAENGESEKSIQRYIYLSRLSDGLLAMVDEGKLGLIQGMDISWLKEEEQDMLCTLLENSKKNLSRQQSEMLKRMSRERSLSLDAMSRILFAEKPKARSVTLSGQKLNQYFPPEMDAGQIEDLIIELICKWKDHREENHEEVSV